MITEEQRKLRRSGIGGSDIAPIMGLSPYTTAREIFDSKSGKDEQDLDGVPSVEWGSRLEAVIAEKFAENHPEFICEFSPETIIKDGWKIANLDGIFRPVGDINDFGGVLEIKTANAFTKDWKDGVPIYYQCQVQWYMHITARKYAYVAVLIGGQDYREFRLERDEAFISEILEKAEQFWNDFLIGVAPPPEPELVMPVEGKSVECPDAIEILDAIYQLEIMSADLDDKRKTLKGKLAEIIEDAEELTINGKTAVTYKAQQTTRLDQKKLQEIHPEIFEKFTKVTTSRVMRIKQL